MDNSLRPREAIIHTISVHDTDTHVCPIGVCIKEVPLYKLWAYFTVLYPSGFDKDTNFDSCQHVVSAYSLRIFQAGRLSTKLCGTLQESSDTVRKVFN